MREVRALFLRISSLKRLLVAVASPDDGQFAAFCQQWTQKKSPQRLINKNVTFTELSVYKHIVANHMAQKNIGSAVGVLPFD